MLTCNTSEQFCMALLVQQFPVMYVASMSVNSALKHHLSKKKNLTQILPVNFILRVSATIG